MGAGMLSLVAPTAAKVFAMNPLLAGAAPGKGYLFPELSSAQRFTMSWGVVAERVVTLIRSTPSRHTPVLSTTMLVSAGFAAETVIVPESNLSDTWTTVWPAGVLRAWDISFQLQVQRMISNTKGISRASITGSEKIGLRRAESNQ